MITRRMFNYKLGSAALGLAPSLSLMRSAAAANYPAGPVKLIVAQGAGGAVDILSRVVADHLGRAWNSQVVVLNLPSGGGVVATRTAAGADSDGHTLYFAQSSAFLVLPERVPSLSSQIADFVPIGFTGEQPMAVAVSPSVEAQSLQELIDLSKRLPGGLDCAVSGRFALAHLTGELLRLRSGANLNFVYYPGAAQALNDVVSGRVKVLINVLAGIVGAVASKQVRLLAIASHARSPNFPSIPIAAEVVPDFVVTGWTALVAPRGTAPAIVNKIHKDLRAIQEQSEFKQQIEKLNVTARPMSQQQTAEYIAAEQAIWRPIVRSLGIQSPN